MADKKITINAQLDMLDQKAPLIYICGAKESDGNYTLKDFVDWYHTKIDVLETKTHIPVNIYSNVGMYMFNGVVFNTSTSMKMLMGTSYGVQRGSHNQIRINIMSASLQSTPMIHLLSPANAFQQTGTGAILAIRPTDSEGVRDSKNGELDFLPFGVTTSSNGVAQTGVNAAAGFGMLPFNWAKSYKALAANKQWSSITLLPIHPTAEECVVDDTHFKAGVYSINLEAAKEMLDQKAAATQQDKVDITLRYHSAAGALDPDVVEQTLDYNIIFFRQEFDTGLILYRIEMSNNNDPADTWADYDSASPEITGWDRELFICSDNPGFQHIGHTKGQMDPAALIYLDANDVQYGIPFNMNTSLLRDDLDSNKYTIYSPGGLLINQSMHILPEAASRSETPRHLYAHHIHLTSTTLDVTFTIISPQSTEFTLIGLGTAVANYTGGNLAAVGLLAAGMHNDTPILSLTGTSSITMLKIRKQDNTTVTIPLRHSGVIAPEPIPDKTESIGMIY